MNIAYEMLIFLYLNLTDCLLSFISAYFLQMFGCLAYT